LKFTTEKKKKTTKVTKHTKKDIIPALVKTKEIYRGRKENTENNFICFHLRLSAVEIARLPKKITG
jgi:hypothetical protein